MLPPRVPLSMALLSGAGAYLLDTGRVLVLWLGHAVSPEFLSQARRLCRDRSSIHPKTCCRGELCPKAPPKRNRCPQQTPGDLCCDWVQALHQASSSGVPDAQALFMEPEKPGSDFSKRLNAVLRCATSVDVLHPDPHLDIATPFMTTSW